MGHHLRDLKVYTYQSLHHIHQKMDNIHNQTLEMQRGLMKAMQQHYKLTSRVANVVNAAVNAAYEVNHNLPIPMHILAANS